MEISNELDQQNKMLNNVNADFEEAIGGLDAVTKKTQELIKKSGEGDAQALQRQTRPVHVCCAVLPLNDVVKRYHRL